ncbi:FUSC family membrane protein [Sediminibacterium soli]|uniref:FUSC family membrane protein n=1 Tax=Sediminibacterium soli TaxID=2698829 RepID=UPI00137A4071|nr:FUSC family membrane protein [Sediminibacterium soli]NCI47554.1 hypothetical protein [Sediminibacterium soli]
MDYYLKQYRSFINSYYVSDGVRMTVAILAPVLLFAYYDLLSVGLAVALGALSVSLTDNPGPIHHRRNGMIVSGLLVFAIALLAGYTQAVPWLFMLVLPACCFAASMIGVYGARATAIGLATLVVLVLQTQHQLAGIQILYNALYLLAGGAWYLLLSSFLHSIRPYKIIQQALGEYVMATAEYLKAKANFYDTGFSYEKDYEEIVRAQIAVQEKQALVADLIFKTRSIVKESTHTSRVLMMVFLDVSDLFEIVMTSHQDYEKLHRYFDTSGILEEYRHLIVTLANELDKIGIALKSGRKSIHDDAVDAELSEERKHLQELRARELSPENLEGFISLRHILDSIDELATRIRTLHQYTTYDARLRRKKFSAPDPDAFITHEPVDPKLLIDNLSFTSNIFRHSLRIAFASLFAYIIAQFLAFGHSYWILLTVIVILKPGYSLTRQRNWERLGGTLIGAALGALSLYLIRDNTSVIILLTLSMIGAYSFMRKQYLVSVILMTLYILLMFHLLDPQDFKSILRDRIIDTAIGSAIAFVFGSLFVPVWEHQQINVYMKKSLTDALIYYQSASGAFTGTVTENKARILLRKNSWVSMANLSDGFTRMLSEPKSKQKKIEQIHQFVVAVHMLNSHIATLSYYIDTLEPEYISQEYIPLINASVFALQQARKSMDGKREEGAPKPDTTQIRILDKRVNELMRKRQEELRAGQMESNTRQFLSDFKSITDQFYFIYKIAVDIEKVSGKIGD